MKGRARESESESEHDDEDDDDGEGEKAANLCKNEMVCVASRIVLV